MRECGHWQRCCNLEIASALSSSDACIELERNLLELQRDRTSFRQF